MAQQRRTSFIRVNPETEGVVMTWEDICRDTTWQGRWVALDECAYNDAGESKRVPVGSYMTTPEWLCP